MNKHRLEQLQNLEDAGKINRRHVLEMLDAIEYLHEWIKVEAHANNTCSYKVLGEICENCECDRLPKSTAKTT